VGRWLGGSNARHHHAGGRGRYQVTCDTGSAAGFANRYGEIEEPRCHHWGGETCSRQSVESARAVRPRAFQNALFIATWILLIRWLLFIRWLLLIRWLLRW